MPINKNQEASTINDDVQGDFITIASHQLRTPIAGIRWSLDTLLNDQVGKLTDKQREIIAGAYQNNKFLAKAVNDLLKVSRLEENKLLLLPEKIDLEELVLEVTKKMQVFAQAFNCQLIITAQKDLPPIYFDPLQLKPIIEGLLDNAVRFTQPNNHQSKVEIVLKSAANFVHCSIVDSGIGIPSDQQDLVFTRFFRARNSIKAQTEGLGLDLYITKKIIELSGGKIDFSSVEGQGTTFNLYFPTSSPSNSQVESKTTETPASAKAANQLQKEREFVNITVHELKAPLGMAKWSLELLKGGKVGGLNTDQLELVNQVYRGNERLLILVRDLLDLAKLQEGRFDVEPKAVDLKSVVDDSVTAFRSQAEKKKIILQLPTLKGTWPTVTGDPNRIAQVLTNLLSNAIKYTPEGGSVRIMAEQVSGSQLKKIGQTTATAEIKNFDNKNGYLIFSVSDSGIGISEADQKKLFSRFFRSKNVLQSKTEGTGLGLYITKTIVNLHHGDIWFTSQVGKGSTFYFSLPIA